MKYAALLYGRNRKQISHGQYVNLGDYFQTFAIENIYHSIGIRKADIYAIDRVHVQEYQGEELLFPMQGWFGRIKGISIFPFPDSVKPVFLGYHCIDKMNYKKDYLNAYKQAAPIGCRDEHSFLMMKKHGINAYLTGCLTITLPERKKTPDKPHIFLVDAPKGIEKYIPEELKNNITYITQEIPIPDGLSEKEENEYMRNTAKKLLERYKNEATLIVTSRLHCAAPCLGMGIPVILARKYFDERYAWIDKYLPLYTPDKFDLINWFPEKADLSEIKPLLIEMAEKIITNASDKEQSMKKIHEYYMDRNKSKTFSPLHVKAYLFLHAKFPKMADFLREFVFQRFTIATARNKSEI